MSGAVDALEDATRWTSKEKTESSILSKQSKISKKSVSDASSSRRLLYDQKETSNYNIVNPVALSSDEPCHFSKKRIGLIADTSATQGSEAQSTSDLLFLKDGRFVNCQVVSDGKRKYLQEVPRKTVLVPSSVAFGMKSEEEQPSQVTTSDSHTTPTRYRALSKMGQLPSANSSLELNLPDMRRAEASRQPDSPRHADYTRHVDCSRHSDIPRHANHRWTEQGIRLANFVEDSIYQSLKSNDEAVVKEWQMKMSEEACIRNGGGEDSSDEDSDSKSTPIETDSLQIDKSFVESSHIETSKSKFSDLPQSSLKSNHGYEYSNKKKIKDNSKPNSKLCKENERASTPKDGKFSLLDALQEKLKHALLSYGHTNSAYSEAPNHTDQFGALFFSPVVDSTVQNVEPASSTDVVCSTQQDEDSLSSRKVFQAGSSQLDVSSDKALDLSKSSVESSGQTSVEKSSTIPSNKSFSLERILHPSTKGSKKSAKTQVMNPFMRTFSDLLDLPPREIKNRDPFKVKRRPYRRRRSSLTQNSSQYEEDGCLIVDSGRESHSPNFLINSSDIQSQPGSSASAETTDWPSVALLMNVYQEWEKKRDVRVDVDSSKDQASFIPGDESSQSSFSSEQPVLDESPEVSKDTTNKMEPSNSDYALTSTSSGTKASSKSKACSCTTQSKSYGGRHFTKKSRLLENVERNKCQCQSAPSAPFGDRHLMNPASIRSLLSTDRGDKRKHGDVGEDKNKRYKADEDVQSPTQNKFITTGGEGQAVCSIS